MKFTYKKVRVNMPFCPKCGKQVFGNGSDILPYECDCGTWHFNQETAEYDMAEPRKK